MLGWTVTGFNLRGAALITRKQLPESRVETTKDVLKLEHT